MCSPVALQALPPAMPCARMLFLLQSCPSKHANMHRGRQQLLRCIVQAMHCTHHLPYCSTALGKVVVLPVTVCACATPATPCRLQSSTHLSFENIATQRSLRQSLKHLPDVLPNMSSHTADTRSLLSQLLACRPAHLAASFNAMQCRQPR